MANKLSPEDPIRIYYITPAPWSDSLNVIVGAERIYEGMRYGDRARLSPLVTSSNNKRYDLELIERRLRHRVSGASLGVLPATTD